MMSLPFASDRTLVVFTDLDGTLIDHHTYGVEGSRDALQKLTDRGISVVFCSSKTFAEQQFLQSQLGIVQPFIFENGSAVAIPEGFFADQPYRIERRTGDYDVVLLAHAHATDLRAVLRQIPEVRGYADTRDAELAAITGLSGDALARARDRWFTETLISPLDEDQAAAIGERLQPDGFTLSRGGRFYTVQSDIVHKGRAVRWLMEYFRRADFTDPCFAGVGDSPNDVPMLEVVDLPFLVQRPDQTWAATDIPHLTRIEAVGPAGFSEMVSRLMVR